jgi:hypothetical protein
MGVAVLATLLFASNASEVVCIDLPWSCFDGSNCPCKAVRKVVLDRRVGRLESISDSESDSKPN